jgi:hypothetical protein
MSVKNKIMSARYQARQHVTFLPVEANDRIVNQSKIISLEEFCALIYAARII